MTVWVRGSAGTVESESVEDPFVGCGEAGHEVLITQQGGLRVALVSVIVKVRGRCQPAAWSASDR